MIAHNRYSFLLLFLFFFRFFLSLFLPVLPAPTAVLQLPRRDTKATVPYSEGHSWRASPQTGRSQSAQRSTLSYIHYIHPLSSLNPLQHISHIWFHNYKWIAQAKSTDFIHALCAAFGKRHHSFNQAERPTLLFSEWELIVNVRCYKWCTLRYFRPALQTFLIQCCRR